MRVRALAAIGVVIGLDGLTACPRSNDTAPDAHMEQDPAATTPPEHAAQPPTEAHADAKTHASPASSSPSPASSTHPAPSSSAPSTPAHPLADWMRGPATQAWSSGNLESIASAFDRMILWAPPGYPNWASIARDGSQAARAGSIEGVKAACRGCHAEYETQYKAGLSLRPLTP